MKRATKSLWGALVTGLLLSSSVMAQTSTVTFNVNSALFPDTLKPTHVVQFRGGINGGTAGATSTPAISWDAASAVATNVGGDYWTLTLTVTEGAELGFKFWAGSTTTTPLVNKGIRGGTEYTEDGWEAGSNRTLKVPVNDTTINVWMGHTLMTTPFVSKKDSVGVLFRVNVGARVQSGLVVPGTSVVEVRGGAPIPGDWSDNGSSPDLDLEPYRKGDNYTYSKILYLPKDANLTYKFHAKDWEGTPDRKAKASKDTTLQWKFFNNEVPSSAPVITSNVTFKLNVGYLTILELFNESIGDVVTIRGGGIFGGWAATSDDANKLIFDNSNKWYSTTKEVKAPAGNSTAYKFFTKYHSSRADAQSANYIPEYGVLSAGQQADFGYEEPLITRGGNRIYAQNSSTTRDLDVVYFNDVSPSGIILKSAVQGGVAAKVTFRVDMTPAINSTVEAEKMTLGTDSVFFSLESKLTQITLKKPAIQRTNPYAYLMTRVGTTNVFTYTLTLDAEATINDFGFNIIFGQPKVADGKWVTSGNGSFDAGRRYNQYIQPVSVGAVVNDPDVGAIYPAVWPAEYNMPVVQWTKGDAPGQQQPNYANFTPVSNEEGGRVDGFELLSNYPNPFNPSTTLQFRTPAAGKVTLEVFNILGQKVATLINNELVPAGLNTRSFDAKNLSSGMYIYRLSANGFTSQRKMMLVK